ncbi:MAG: glycosyltransferase [Flavobacteriales bacterium]|nr:glycosyltransferase [Flavobacteriales bacterium]
MKYQGNIMVITYWSLNDALIQTYTLPYLRQIRSLIGDSRKIILVCLEKNGTHHPLTQLEPGIEILQLPYIPFGGKAALKWLSYLTLLKKTIRTNAVGVIHAWCTPAGMIAYLLSKKTGKPLIIDSFEPHAEAMVENGSWKPNSMAFRLLFRYEKQQYKQAQHLICCTESMKDYAEKKYGKTHANFYVKPACVDRNLFSFNLQKRDSLRRELLLENKTVMVYAGKLGGIYLDEEVFRFIKQSIEVFGENFRVLFLSAHTIEEIHERCMHFAIPTEFIQLKFVPHREVPDYMMTADFAITPVKPVPSKRFCSPIKDGEYWSLGLPVVITENISDDSSIIHHENAGVILREFTDSALRKAAREMKKLLDDENPETLRSRIQQLAIQHRNFENSLNVYRAIYD